MRDASPAEQRFDLLVGSIKDYAIFLLDSGGHIVTWNAGARLIKGYEPEEVIGKHISIFYTPEDLARQKPQALLKAASTDGRVEDIGWRVRKDGGRFWADVVITCIPDHGRENGFIKVTRDLTLQKQAEERLRASEESLVATLYSIGDGVLACDEHARVTRINPVAERLTGWREREAVGRPLTEVFPIINEETRAEVPNPVTRVLAEGAIVGLGNHTLLVSRDGTEHPIADSGAPIRDAEGTTRGAVLVFRDVTQERQAAETLRQTQEAVRRSEESLRATLYSIGDGVLSTDENARVTRVNPVAERLTGWPEKDALGRPIEEVFDIFNEETRAKAVNPIGRVLAEGVVVGLANHTGLRSREGVERPIADSGAPILDSDGKARGAVLVFRDVSAERAAEEALRQSEERLRLMIASVRDYAIYRLDPTGRVASWNPGAERIKGYRQEEIVGRPFSLFFTPEDLARERPARELETATKEGRFEEEGWRVRKDGSRFWASVVVTPICEASGRLVGFVKVTRDLTERRRSDEERLRLAQAREAVRLRDEFLSIASHELKTPLTALQLQLLNIHDHLGPENEGLSRNLDRARRLADRLGQLVEALLDVSRLTTGRLKLNLESFDLGDAGREVIERLGESARMVGCELSLQVVGAVQGRWDRLRIEQVLTNLISNAIKYAAGSPIRVSLAMPEPNVAVIEVYDGGPGIPEAQLTRIFERFERAASARHYGGLGLGLYVARQIAEAHGGSIGARNLPSGGACFTVRLPLDPPPAQASQSP